MVRILNCSLEAPLQLDRVKRQLSEYIAAHVHPRISAAILAELAACKGGTLWGVDLGAARIPGTVVQFVIPCPVLLYDASAMTVGEGVVGGLAYVAHEHLEPRRVRVRTSSIVHVVREVPHTVSDLGVMQLAGFYPPIVVIVDDNLPKYEAAIENYAGVVSCRVILSQ